MNLQAVFESLFPDHEYTTDAEALAQLRDEVEILREQLAVRVGDVRRMFAEYVRSHPRSGLADLLLLSRDLAEQNADILQRGKLPAERSVAEMQRAHDTLVGMLANKPFRDLIVGDSQLDLEMIKGNADVLCWALGHSHNKTFKQNLAAIEAELFAHGVVISR